MEWSLRRKYGDQEEGGSGHFTSMCKGKQYNHQISLIRVVAGRVATTNTLECSLILGRELYKLAYAAPLTQTLRGVNQYTVTDFNNEGKTVILGNAGGLGITDGDIIVATTTDSVGNTSEFSSLDTVVVTDISLTISNLPEVYALYQNYPNPFNPVSKIKYDIPELSFVTIKVYDVLGSEIITLVNEEKPIGSYEVEFNSHSGSVRNLTSGIYFYRLRANEFTQVKKMILLK